MTLDTNQNAIHTGYISAPNTFGFKNRIINGGMVISQRNGTNTVTPADADYTLDRWRFFLSQASKITMQQNQGSVTPPPNFAKYLGITSSSAYSVGSSERFSLMTSFESSNVYDFAWGTANAKPVTLSFWVYSSLTGTFGGAVRNWAYTYSYPFSYTISSANTWTYITVNITAPTSGTWVMDASNGGAIELLFNLGAGSTYSGTAGAWSSANYTSCTGATSIVGTNGATFYITGVQLESGKVATPFDWRPYGTEFMLCQRYCQTRIASEGSNGTTVQLGYGNARSSSVVYWQDRLQVKMRVAPSLTVVNAATGGFYVYSTGASFATGVSYDVSDPNTMLGLFSGLSVTSPTFYTAGISAPATGQVIYSAEL
jgi:hypothetical protein